MKHWWTDSEQNSKLEEVSLEAFRALVLDAPPHRDIREIILHHSWLPAVAHYRGRQTWVGIDACHQNKRGWSDIGYHIGIGPDQTVWLLRPLPRSGAHTLGHNSRSIGICMIGNFDEGHDDPTKPLQTAAQVVRALTARYALGPGDVYFHRDFASKSCPGTSIGRATFRASLNFAPLVLTEDNAEEPDTPSTGVYLNGEPIGPFVNIGGVGYVPVRAIAEACELTVKYTEPGRVDLAPKTGGAQ